VLVEDTTAPYTPWASSLTRALFSTLTTGKSSHILTVATGAYVEVQEATAGSKTTMIEFNAKKQDGEELRITFRIKDVNGQQKPGPHFWKHFFEKEDVKGVIVMGSHSCVNTLLMARMWYMDGVPLDANGNKIPTAMVANKSDCPESENLERWCRGKFNVKYTSMSVQNGVNIYKPFEDLASMINKKLYDNITITGVRTYSDE
jgi:hypothetical protein